MLALVSDGNQGNPEELSDPAAILSNVFEVSSVEGKRPSGGIQPNDEQRKFAQYYVLNGGNATAAARSAGYQKPHMAGPRLIQNAKVLHEIKRLSLFNMQAALPRMLTELGTIALDRSIDPKIRIPALLGWLDRAGLRPKSDMPSVAVQVNVNGESARAAIEAAARAASDRKGQTTCQRLSAMGSGGRGVSDIPDTMTDSIEGDDAPDDVLDLAWDGGGMQIQGPPAPSDPIPTHPPEHTLEIPEGGEE